MAGQNPLNNPDSGNPYIAARSKWNERYPFKSWEANPPDPSSSSFHVLRAGDGRD